MTINGSNQINYHSMIEFIITGKPVGKERPRLGKNGKFYTPKKTKDYEKRVALLALEARNKHGIFVPSFHWISVKIYALFSGKKLSIDIDNIAKTILDGMNGIMYQDDSQVIILEASKVKSHDDIVIVNICEAFQTNIRIASKGVSIKYD